MEPSDDLTPALVRDLRAGHEHAGNLLHELYHDRLRRYCQSILGTEQEAEDAVQDVFCRVIESRVLPDHFPAWIIRIARNHCLGLLRRRGRRGNGEPMPSSFRLAADCTTHLSRLVRAEEGERFATSLCRLPPELQELLHLRYVEDLPRTEIARVLGWRESIVKSRLFETVNRLRDEWGRSSPSKNLDQ